MPENICNIKSPLMLDILGYKLEVISDMGCEEDFLY
jgi:hypothetical protein